LLPEELGRKASSPLAPPEGVATVVEKARGPEDETAATSALGDMAGALPPSVGLKAGAKDGGWRALFLSRKSSLAGAGSAADTADAEATAAATGRGRAPGIATRTLAVAAEFA